MKGRRIAGAAAAMLTLAARIVGPMPALAASSTSLDDVVTKGPEAPLFRVFLKDGGSLVSFGELARVGTHVVFSMPVTTSVDNPQLHLIDLSAERVDWERTDRYADSVRAARYLSTRAEADYRQMTAQVESMLADVAKNSDSGTRLALVEQARRTLAGWPATHYNYKADEVKQTLEVMDDVVNDLRAAAGIQRFDLNLVSAPATPARAPLMPAPDTREIVEQMMTAAKIAETAAEKKSLLTLALATISNATAMPASWVAATRAAANEALNYELEMDREYRALANRVATAADVRARAADVRALERLIPVIRKTDESLNHARPDVVAAMIANGEEQLEAARRQRLERDMWAIRLPELRKYRAAIATPLQRLKHMEAALVDIRDLAGSGPDEIGAILRAAAQIRAEASAITAPPELEMAHGLMLSAAQLAENAATLRRQASLTGNLSQAWNASSAAAGALMLSNRVRTEMTAALEQPQPK
jgi:hypothetical protein